MLNKILSIKIKSPLSLRGLFPFCHSRESGNPSSLSLRGAKRRSNLSGFSLIELMVAVAILAMAIFGIFNAFSSGWMGMANARDRTVAINYAQEILEDIKNTPFEKIHSESTSQIDDTKFSRNINSININPNVKEITAQVTWKNWRDSVKNVEASTLIYSQFSSKPTSEAVALVLYAEPYYNILPGSANTVLTVLVQDKNGNLVTDGGKDILFSVDDPLMGGVLPSSITTQNGKATVFFTSLGEFGEVVIVASSTDLTSDSVTLKITDAAVAIKLEADPPDIDISTGENESTITVSLLNASYIDPPATISEHLITLYVKEGPGTITPISVLLNEENKTNIIVLTSSGTPGIVTIVASSMDLESGVVNIPILGTAGSISIASNPSSIHLNGDTEMTVTIKDSAGNPVLYSGYIELSLVPSNGSLSDDGDDYNEVTGILTFSNDASSKTITYTASDSDADDVNITATDVAGELSSDTVTIYISEGRKIKLTAEPEIMIADGEDSSTITATILDTNNEIVTNEIYQIVFAIYSGEGYLSGPNPQETVDGVAEINLISTIEPSIITVSARAMDLTPDSIDIQTIYPKFISISADKDWLYINEHSNILITVLDSNGDPVVDYFGLINLTLSDPGSGFIVPETFNYSTPTTTIFTAQSTGEVTITANGDGVNSDSITIQILEEGEITLTLADNITTSDGGKTISFDISNDGSGGLEIVQMQVIWNSLSMLDQVQARAPTDSDPVIVYDGPAVDSGTLINIVSTILPFGITPNNISTISLTFSGNMNGKTITVMFFDNDLTQYGPLEFTVP